MEGEEIKERKGDVTERLRRNPWILSTFVLVILVVVLLAGSLGNFSFTGNTISGDEVGAKFIALASSQLSNIKIIDITKENGIYNIKFTSDETGESLIYTTLDGSYLITSLMPLDTSSDSNGASASSQVEVPKSDKPKVELFVMSYCPYGTQAEKGILPVVALLGDKIDFNLRMVHYTLHGEKEDIENNRELCIREEQGKDKLNKYLVCILDSSDPYNPKDVTQCEKETGINSAKLKDCLNNKADGYFEKDSSLSQGYGVQGSPTLIINGVQSSAGRSPASYLDGICSAFTDGSVPEECGETLSSSTPSAGFGYNQGTDTVAQC